MGRVKYVDLRQSTRNGGGPACLPRRVVLPDEELAAANPRQRFTPALHDDPAAGAHRHARDRLSVDDLADPALLDESRAALDALAGLLGLGSGFYPFQR